MESLWELVRNVGKLIREVQLSVLYTIFLCGLVMLLTGLNNRLLFHVREVCAYCFATHGLWLSFHLVLCFLIIDLALYGINQHD